MRADFRGRLLAYFEEAAESYAAYIEPAFFPLVESFVDAAGLRPGDAVLDLGTGTGLAARIAAPRCRFVAAMDFSHRMAVIAAGRSAPHVFQGDMHCLPLRSAAFDVVLAVLAFNSTDPARSMPEAYRALRPGGRLAMQEWGTSDELSVLLDDTLAEYAVEDPGPDLAARREARFAYHPWDEFETSTDIADELEAAGFEHVEIDVVTPEVVFEEAADFIRYKLAWPFRRAEVEAMPAEVRALCLSDLDENLSALSALALPSGKLVWQPNLVRVFAQKPR